MATETKVRRTKTKPKMIGKEISVEAAEPGLHETAEGITRPVWRISPERSSGNLLKLLRVSRGSGLYVKILPDKVNIPEELAQQLEAAGEPDESVVFLSTRMGYGSVQLMLALRYSDRWREIGRWKSRWTQMRVARNEICEI